MDLTHPCQYDEIVVPGHPLDDANSGDKPENDEGCRHAEQCDGDGKHDRPSILEMGGSVRHTRPYIQRL